MHPERRACLGRRICPERSMHQGRKVRPRSRMCLGKTHGKRAEEAWDARNEIEARQGETELREEPEAEFL